MAPNDTAASKSTRVKVAVTQIEPEWLDLQASVAKTCKYITEAAQNGAEVVAFAEAFIPGYPAWIWSRPLDPILSTRYIKNSLVIESDEMRKIQDCAQKNGIVVSLGFSENDNNSLYIAQAIIDSSGEIIVQRRKLKPTHMERTIFGDASGNSLVNVAIAHTRRGWMKIGALACWEHCQPLLKFHTLQQKEDIHCAAWPPIVSHSGGPDLWSLSKEGCLSLSQVYAIESQTFVLHSTQIITENGIKIMSTQDGVLMSKPGGGASCIVGCDGRIMSKELEPTEEGIIYAEVDMDQAVMAKSFLDVTGHYSRPDLLWLGADTRERKVKIDDHIGEAEVVSNPI